MYGDNNGFIDITGLLPIGFVRKMLNTFFGQPVEVACHLTLLKKTLVAAPPVMPGSTAKVCQRP